MLILPICVKMLLVRDINLTKMSSLLVIYSDYDLNFLGDYGDKFYIILQG